MQTSFILPSQCRYLPHFVIISMCFLSTLPSSSFGQPSASDPGVSRETAATGAAIPKKEEEEKIVELSPFVVQTEADRGYEAENTLSGTRLNTPAKYLASAITEVTQALMQDLAIYSTEDVIDFTPNAGSYGSAGTLASDTLLIGAASGPRFNVRGLVVSTASRDFIKTRVADDAYNIDRISVDRGPNSVLFGLGDPGGIINAVSTHAVMKNSYQVATRFDNWDSYRSSFRINQQLVKNKVAIFLAGLDEDKKTNREPSSWKTDRLTGSVTIKPFSSTTVRATFEQGDVANLIVPPWPTSDGITRWIAAGSQEIPASVRNGGIYNATGPTRPSAAIQNARRAELIAAGFQLALRSNATMPMIVMNGSESVTMPPLDDLGYVQTAGSVSGVAGVTNATLLDSPLPYTANVTGYGSQRLQHFQNHTINMEQAIGKNLFLSATFNRQNTNQVVDRSAYVLYDQLYLDKNPTVVTMYGTVIPNPNYDRYYTMAPGAGVILQHYDDDTLQFQAAYKLDFRNRVSGLAGKILGHHEFGVLREQVTSGLLQTSVSLANLSPQSFVGVTPQFNAANATNIRGGANTPVVIIHYIDPSDPSSWATPALASMFGGAEDPLFAGSPVPAADPSGLTPGWLATANLRTLSKTNTQSFVVQSFFWDDRIVTTFGLRQDATTTRSLTLAQVDYNGQSNWLDNLGNVDPYTGNSLHPLTYYEQEGKTKTMGIVVYPTPWFGLFFNQSENYQPATSAQQVDIFGVPLSPSNATGRDWGIKLSLLDGKITASLDRYTIQQVNSSTSIYRSGFGGTFTRGLQGPLNALANTLYTLTGDPVFTTYPWPTDFPWYSVNDVQAEGYEFSVTANPTPNWRLTANVSKQSAVASNYGATEQRWYETQLAFVTNTYSQYLNAPPIQNGARGVPETVAQDFEDAAAVLAQAQTLAGRADARQARYSGNLVTAYDFTTGTLKGLGIGGTYKWRTKEAIGYAFQPGSTTLFDASKPYYGPSRNPIGLFVSYRFKIARGIRAKVQLNANNINMSEDIYPFTMTDSGDGTPVVSKYAVGGGKTYALSVTLDF